MARRVLIACKYLPPETEGGGALTVRALAESLVESGVEVTILKAEAKPGTTPGRVAGARIVETPYRDRFDYRDRGMPDFYGQLAAKRFNHASYRRTMLRLITETRFDLIHAQNHTTALAGVAALGSGPAGRCDTARARALVLRPRQAIARRLAVLGVRHRQPGALPRRVGTSQPANGASVCLR